MPEHGRARKPTARRGLAHLTGAARRGTGESAGVTPADGLAYRRRLVAQLCRMLGDSIAGEPAAKPATPQTDPTIPSLSPRMKQTLDRLLAGDSEKQIAHRFGLSRHTVHVYVKGIYKSFGVSSRGELLARFVTRPTIR